MPTETVALTDLALHVPLSDPQLSPDGSRVALLVSRCDYEANCMVNQLVIVDVRSRAQRTLTLRRPQIRQPRWSPDGSRLAILAADTQDTAQIFLLDPDSGETRQLTRSPEHVLSFAWRPTGTDLVFIASDPLEPREGEERHNQSFEVGAHGYLARASPRPAHLWRIAADGGAAIRLTSGEWSVNVLQAIPGLPGSMDWSPDGRTLAFLRQPTPDPGAIFRLSLDLLDVDTGERRVLWPGPKALSFPRFSPDGTRILCQQPVDAEPLFNPSGLFAIPIDGGPPLHVTPALDRDLSGGWLPDGTLLIQGFDGTRRGVWHQEISGEPRRIELGSVDPISAVSHSCAGALALIGVQPDRPPELYHLASVHEPVQRLTDFNASLASRRIGRVQRIEWDGPDGRLDGTLLTPPDFDPMRKYPLVLWIHGGPMGTSTEGWITPHQIAAARGWLIFCPNYRGSNNAGRQFQRSIIGDPGAGPAADVMAGVEELRRRGFVDGDRMAVTGWSYGGFMSTWLAAHFNVWRAVVAGAPVTDWLDWYTLTDLNTWISNGLGGSPWIGEHARNYWSWSPLSHAQRIRAPTLILSCTGDDRVPITHAYRLFHALRDNNVEVSFVAYPVQGHYPADPVHQRDLLRRWLDWLDAHLQ